MVGENSVRAGIRDLGSSLETPHNCESVGWSLVLSDFQWALLVHGKKNALLVGVIQLLATSQ